MVLQMLGYSFGLETRAVYYFYDTGINRRLYIYFRLTVHATARFRFSAGLSDANGES